MKIRYYYLGEIVEREVYKDGYDSIYESLLEELAQCYGNLKFFPINAELGYIRDQILYFHEEEDYDNANYWKDQEVYLKELLKKEQRKNNVYDDDHYFFYAVASEVVYEDNCEIIYVPNGNREDGLKSLVDGYQFEEIENLEFFPFCPHLSNSEFKILDVDNETVYYVVYRDYEYQLFHEFKKDEDGDPLKLGNLKAINLIDDELYKFRVELDKATDDFPDKEWYFEGEVYKLVRSEKFDSRLEGG